MEYRIFTLDELHNYLFDSCGGDWDLFVKCLDDIRGRIKYFGLDGGMWRDDFFVVCMDGGRIVGVLDYVICTDGPTTEGYLHFISYVSVDGEYWGRGISKGLLAEWEKIRRFDLGECGCSGFTQMGFDYLRPKLLALGVKCNDYVSF